MPTGDALPQGDPVDGERPGEVTRRPGGARIRQDSEDAIRQGLAARGETLKAPPAPSTEYHGRLEWREARPHDCVYQSLESPEESYVSSLTFQIGHEVRMQFAVLHEVLIDCHERRRTVQREHAPPQQEVPIADVAVLPGAERTRALQEPRHDVVVRNGGEEEERALRATRVAYRTTPLPRGPVARTRQRPVRAVRSRPSVLWPWLPGERRRRLRSESTRSCWPLPVARVAALRPRSRDTGSTPVAEPLARLRGQHPR